MPVVAIRAWCLLNCSYSGYSICPLPLLFSRMWILSFREYCFFFCTPHITAVRPHIQMPTSSSHWLHMPSELLNGLCLFNIVWLYPCLHLSLHSLVIILLHYCSSFSTNSLILQILLCLTWFSLLNSFPQSPSTFPFLSCCPSLPPADLVIHASLSRDSLNKLCFLTSLQPCICPLPEIPLHTPFHFTCLSFIPARVSLIDLLNSFTQPFLCSFIPEI